jgi:hypothetical protein
VYGAFGRGLQGSLPWFEEIKGLGRAFGDCFASPKALIYFEIEP